MIEMKKIFYFKVGTSNRILLIYMHVPSSFITDRDAMKMEVLNCASTGAMGSILRKLDDLLRLRTDEDEAQAICMRQLRDGAASIGTKLSELSEVHDPPLTVTYWMRDARDLSYDMEDRVDLLIVDADSDARKTAWVVEVSGLRTREEDVMERYHRFKLEHVLIRSRGPQAATKTAASHRLRQTASDEDPDSVAPEGPKAEIVTLLKPKGDDEKELQLKVVSILGAEGVGKSALAQELWRILGKISSNAARS